MKPEPFGHYEGGLSPEESPKSLNSLESLGRILRCFPQSGGSLESLEPLNL